MKQVILISAALLFTAPALANRYEKKIESNFQEYNKYDSKKKNRMINKWKAFKKKTNWDQLSPKEREKVKKRFL